VALRYDLANGSSSFLALACSLSLLWFALHNSDGSYLSKLCHLPTWNDPTLSTCCLILCVNSNSRHADQNPPAVQQRHRCALPRRNACFLQQVLETATRTVCIRLQIFAATSQPHRERFSIKLGNTDASTVHAPHRQRTTELLQPHTGFTAPGFLIIDRQFAAFFNNK